MKYQQKSIIVKIALSILSTIYRNMLFESFVGVSNVSSLAKLLYLFVYIHIVYNYNIITEGFG